MRQSLFFRVKSKNEKPPIPQISAGFPVRTGLCHLPPFSRHFDGKLSSIFV